MGYMKQNMENCIEALARKAGYAYDCLMDHLMEWLFEADRDGEPFNWEQFEAVAMEHDF